MVPSLLDPTVMAQSLKLKSYGLCFLFSFHLGVETELSNAMRQAMLSLYLLILLHYIDMEHHTHLRYLILSN
jgi:hypothetical protein